MRAMTMFLAGILAACPVAAVPIDETIAEVLVPTGSEPLRGLVSFVGDDRRWEVLDPADPARVVARGWVSYTYVNDPEIPEQGLVDYPDSGSFRWNEQRPGPLTFTYQVRVDADSPGALDVFRTPELGESFFDRQSAALDVGYVSPSAGEVAPERVTHDAFGRPDGMPLRFEFGPRGLQPGESSALLYVRTDGIGNVWAIGGVEAGPGEAAVRGLGATTLPEPRIAWIALAAALWAQRRR